MPEFTPDDQEPVVRGTYDATAGAFASLDRAARREEAVKRYLYTAHAIGESFEATIGLDADEVRVVQAKTFDEMAKNLIEELHEIDRS